MSKTNQILKKSLPKNRLPLYTTVLQESSCYSKNSMITTIDSSYDRAAELKAFDETKAGVKGLVDTGISTIPKFFIHPHNDQPSKTHASIPVIDMSDIENDPNTRRNIVSRVRDASETWGFFQVVNHGIPTLVLEGMLEGVRRFYEQDNEVKKGYYTRDYSKKMGYNSNYDLFSESPANWRDSFFCYMAPNPPTLEDLPSTCREIMDKYSKQVIKLGRLLMELLSEALGLNPTHLNDMGCSEGLSVLCHYYPCCPQPELTLGTSKHADDDFMTVLLQDHIGGLQVLQDDQWFDIPPVAGALVVNVGDLLQLITNDKFKSIEHRVLANKEGPRVSVACFFSTGYQVSSRRYGPIDELLSQNNPPIYKEVSVQEFVAYGQTKGLDGVSNLLNFRL